jgi:hypothetical protein
LIDLLPNITGDKLDSRLHFGHNPLGFVDPIETTLAELFVLGNGANRLNVRADICGDELAVATHTALQVHKVIGLADGLKALFDLLALLGKSLVLTAGRFEGLLGLCKAHRRFWGAAWPALCGLLVCAFKTHVHLIKSLLCLAERLVGSPLFGGQGCTNGGTEGMLDMEHVW